MRRTMALIVVALALAMPGSVGAARAQAATPGAGLPVAPDPAECTAAPRTPDDLAGFAALVGTPLPEIPTASAIPVGGEPADPAAVAGVVATVRRVLACANAGDVARYASFFTDAGLRQFVATLGEDERSLLTAPPTPLPTEERLALIDVRDAARFDDGRFAAVVVNGDPPGSEQGEYIFFVERDGRYLIDAFVEDFDLPAEGTPTP